VQALQRSSGVTRSAFLNAVYQTGSFDVNGWLLGPFSDTTVTTAAAEIIDACNQGSRLVQLSELSGSVVTRCTLIHLLRIAVPATNFLSHAYVAQITINSSFTFSGCTVVRSYSDGLCPLQSTKSYTNPDVTLAFTCTPVWLFPIALACKPNRRDS